MSNGLDPDQDRCSTGADLGLNCLQRYQTTSSHHWGKLNVLGLYDWRFRSQLCADFNKIRYIKWFFNIMWRIENLEYGVATSVPSFLLCVFGLNAYFVGHNG